MKAIELISVPVSDQLAAKNFYLKMGLKLERELPFGANQTWIEFSFPNGGVRITLVTWFQKMPAGCLQGVTIDTDNIQKSIDDLKRNGIVTGAIEETPWGKFASITDPDGNSWSLHQQN